MPLIDQGKYRGSSGTIVLNEGLLTFSITTGIFSKAERIILRMPIDAIIAVAVEGTIKRKLVITVDKNKIQGIPRHEFEVNDPYKWMNALNGEIYALSTKIKSQTQPIREVYVKETTKEIIKVPCKYCGTLNVITDEKCSSCGAPIR